MKTIDRFSLEIIQSSFKAISEEMFITMQKTAMSPIIYEILDMGVGISDKDGNTLSSGAGIPAFIGMLEFSIKIVSNKFKHSVKKGDIYLTNDPYNGGVTHLNDMVIIKPVFFGERLVAWVANMAHWPDIGGMVPGGISSDATELYQEGLIIPAIKAFEDNKPIPAVIDIIKANSRMAYALEGDLYAGIASVNKGEARMVELVSKYGLEHFEAATVDLQNYGESVSRKALKSLPKGKFETEEKLDDGRLIKAKIEITEDKFIVDMRENPPQNAGPDNVSRDGVVIAAQLIFKAITSPNTDSNAGTYRPLKVLTKKGTIFDPFLPAACGIYYDTDIRANDLIWRAIFPYVKDKLTVGHFSSICGTFFGGVNPDNNKPFTIVEPQIGGWGASNESDGINALFSSFHGDTFNCPAEIAESRYGVYVNRLSLSDLEGGAGEFRGGKGICLEYKMRSKSWLSVGYSRSVVKPWSFDGAQEGGVNFVKIIRTNGQTEEYYMKSGIMLDEDDIIQVNTANGGGYGDPKKRNPEKVLEDLKNGYISEKEAKEIYQYH